LDNKDDVDSGDELDGKKIDNEEVGSKPNMTFSILSKDV
jgi:hypothetical protein